MLITVMEIDGEMQDVYEDENDLCIHCLRQGRCVDCVENLTPRCAYEKGEFIGVWCPLFNEEFSEAEKQELAIWNLL